MSRIATPAAIANRFDVKNIKSGFGHDKAGLYADIYLDNRKVGYYNDDGWGGDVEIRWDNEATQKIFFGLLTQVNYAQLMFDNGWNFMKIEELNSHQQEECCLEAMIDAKEEDKAMEKFRKKMEKEMVNSLILGESLNSGSYRPVGWKGRTLAQVITAVGGPDKFISLVKQQVKFKPGEKILNTNLEALGVKFD